MLQRGFESIARRRHEEGIAAFRLLSEEQQFVQSQDAKFEAGLLRAFDRLTVIEQVRILLTKYRKKLTLGNAVWKYLFHTRQLEKLDD